MKRRQRIEDLLTLSVPEEVALSPDAGQIVYVLRTIDADADRAQRALWTVGAETGEPRQLTYGTADSAPSWSPAGTEVAFLRALDGPPQLWLLPMAGGGEPEQLTTLPLGAGSPRWSPDGSKIAFTAGVDLLAGPADDDDARARRAAAPIVVDRLDYQADGVGFVRTIRKHVHVLDVATKDCRQVTSGDWQAGEPAWSPNGRELAYTGATDSDLGYRVPAYVVDAAADSPTPRLVGLADGVAGAVAWTADGSALLVPGTTGEPGGHAGLLRVPLNGDPIVDLAAPLDRNVMFGQPAYPGALPQLAGDGLTLLFCVRDRGCTHVYAVPADGGTPRPVVTGAGRYTVGLSVVGSTAAVVIVTPTSNGEVAAVDLATGAETLRTDYGPNLDEIDVFLREDREFTISDGTVVHGWLIRDRTSKGPQPLLLDIHGGPHNAWNGAADEVHLYHQELAARGWAVLLLNPRASDGYGEAFFTAARGAWGEADANDFLEPLDELVAEGLADPDRLAVAGYSYGGFMTCYLTSRFDRFAAAVAGGPVADLASMDGTSDLGHFLSEYELGGPGWAQPERYQAMSPLTRVDQVSTPTLILHGGADVRCPIGQAQEWYAALRERGVPTRLVLYPGGSHLFILSGRPSHRVDFNQRIVDWVEQYAGGSS